MMDGFDALCDLLQDVVVSVDPVGTIRFANSASTRILGYPAAELIGRAFEALLHPDDAQRWRGLLATQGQPTRSVAQNLRLRNRDGSWRVLQTRVRTCHDVAGIGGLLVCTHDVSARVDAEHAQVQLNRALRVLSAVNSAVIHADDETALLGEVCRASVELGGYLMAWVGYTGDDEERRVWPVACAGIDPETLRSIRVTWGDDELGRGATGRAIRSGVPQTNRDFLVSPITAPWQDIARRQGFQSSVSLPLKDAGQTFGAMMIYAPEPDAFHEEEVALLVKLAEEFAFGVVALRARKAHRQAQQSLERLAYFDPLTGLANRANLLEHAARMLHDDAEEEWALVTLDIDSFSDIQTGIGIAQADQLLTQLAGRLRASFADATFLARTGDDLFCLLFPGGAARAAELARQVESILAPPFVQASLPLTIQVYIGAALATMRETSAEALLLRSTTAARQAKQRGVSFLLDGGGAAPATSNLTMVTELREAIDGGQLLLHYQPKVGVADGAVCGVEALVRWRHPTRGLVPPAEFISVAERTGLIEPLTWWVLEAAVNQCHAWRQVGIEVPVAVNVSVRNLRDDHFATRLDALLSRVGLPACFLQLEITESVLMHEPASTHDLLERLRRAGLCISIDDFGTGYSSLSYIANLPIQALKIDRCFVQRMLDSPRVHAVVKATVSLAAALGIRTIAEGVETTLQVDELMAMGCDEVQGFLFSRPVDAEALVVWIDGFAKRLDAARPSAAELAAAR